MSRLAVSPFALSPSQLRPSPRPVPKPLPFYHRIVAMLLAAFLACKENPQS